MTHDEIMKMPLYSVYEIQEIIGEDPLLSQVGNVQGAINIIRTMKPDYRIDALNEYIANLYDNDDTYLIGLELEYERGGHDESLANFVYTEVYNDKYIKDVTEFRNKKENPEHISEVLKDTLTEIKERMNANESDEITTEEGELEK